MTCPGPIEEEGRPRIGVESTIHDFGTLHERRPVNHTFMIENQGDALLIIHKVDLDEDCLLAQVSGAIQVPVGGHTRLEVTLNLGDHDGELKRFLRVHSNDPLTPVLALSVRALVQVDYEFAQPFLYFKEMEPGDRTSLSVQVKSYMDKPLQLTDFVTSHDCIKAAFREDEKLGCYFIDVEVTADALAAHGTRIGGKVEFTANSQGRPRGSLSVLVSLAPDLVPQPLSIRRTDLDPDKAYLESITLENPVKRAYTVADLQFSNSLIRIIDWHHEGDTIRINYTLGNHLQSSSLVGRFEVELVLDSPRRILIPFKGELSEEAVLALGLDGKPAPQAGSTTTEAPPEPAQDMDLSTCPRIVVDRESHDFGVVSQGEELEADFIISNEGHEDLSIDHVHAGCGCATVNDLKGKVLKPGSSETLTVRISTKNRSENFRKAVRIDTNDPVNKSKKIQVAAYIHVDYLLKGPVIRFLDIREGMQETRRIEVRSFMDQPLELTDFSSSHDYVTCTYTPGQGEEKGYIELALDTTGQKLGIKTIFGRIKFKTNSVQLPTGSTSFFIEPIEDIKAEPRKLFLYKYHQSNHTEDRIKLTNVLGKSFAIKSVELDLDCVDVEVVNSGGETAEILARLNGKPQKGRSKASIVVHFDYEGQERLEIPITVMILNKN